MRRALKVAAAGAVVAVLGGTALSGWRFLTTDPRFTVRQVRFTGSFEHVPRAALAAAARACAQGNLWRIDLEAVRARMEALPWVYSAVVSRRWPDTLEVALTEQQIVAQWGERWLNVYGQPVDLAGHDLPQGLPALAGPRGTGAEVLRTYVELASELAPLKLGIAALTLSDRRTWRVRTANGLLLVLGHQPQMRLARFVDAYPALEAYGRPVERVDLRYTDGFAVEWQHGARAAAAQGVSVGEEE